MSRYARSFAWIVAAFLWPLTFAASATTHEGVIRRYLIVHGDSISGSLDQDTSE